MRKLHFIGALLTFCGGACATDVYLKSSGPPNVPVIGVTHSGGTEVVETMTAHGLSVGDPVIAAGVCQGTGPSYVNGYGNKVKTVVDSTHVALQTLAGADLPDGGTFCNTSTQAPGAMWIGKGTAYTLGVGPLGYLGENTGTFYRQLATGTFNGLTSIVVSGTTGAQVVTVTTSYAHGMLPLIPGTSTPEFFSVWGTSDNRLNTAGTGTATLGTGTLGTSFQVASATTFTFTSTATNLGSLSNGDYTSNPHCGPAASPDGTIGGVEECARVSQIAYTNSDPTKSNPVYDGILIDLGNSGTFGSGVEYKHVFDGGQKYSVPQDPGGFLKYVQLTAWYFVFNQTGIPTGYTTPKVADILHYGFTHLERIGGVNFNVRETDNDGNAGQEFASGEIMQLLGIVYGMWARFEPVGSSSNAGRIGHRNKVFNDRDDPNQPICTSTNVSAANNAKQLASGTAQAVSSNSITLATGDTQADNYYNHNVVAATWGGNVSYGVPSAYSSSTKVASGITWSGGTPSGTTTYKIYASMIVSSASLGYNGATATATGYNTHWSTELAIGDAVIGVSLLDPNNWTSDVAEAQSYVCGGSAGCGSPIDSPASDAAVTIINSSGVLASTSTPSVEWVISKFDGSHCGILSAAKHWVGAAGAQKILYPPFGGGQTNTNYGPVSGSNNEIRIGDLNIGLTYAADDVRAIRALAIGQSFTNDYEMAHYMTYLAGMAHSGPYYNGVVQADTREIATMLALSVPSFPSMDMTGPWQEGQTIYNMYSILPDYAYVAGDGYNRDIAWFGFVTGFSNFRTFPGVGSYSIDGTVIFNPNSDTASYFRDNLETASTPSLWGGFYNTGTAYRGQALLYNNPKVVPKDFTLQPLQYKFEANSATAATALSGWTYDANFRGNAVISKSDWSRYNSSDAKKASTFTWFGARARWNEYDMPEGGVLNVYKMGPLLANDGVNGLWGSGCNGAKCTGTIGDSPQFGGNDDAQADGADSNQPGVSGFTRYWSATHGAFPSPYGDALSRAASSCVDLSGQYPNLPGGFTGGFASKCFMDFKKASTDQFLFQLVDLKVASATTIAWHLHFAQNKENTPPNFSAYSEGSTDCPVDDTSGASSNCAAINTNRLIREKEDGSTDAYNPQRKYGMMTRVTAPTPSSIAVSWDCPLGGGPGGSDDCSPASTYSGGNGHTDRVGITAAGGSVTSTKSLVTHKIMQSLTDTTFSQNDICGGCTIDTGDSHWIGAQACGAIDCKVGIFALNNATYTTLAFTSTHAGTAQYMISGLTPGTVHVYRNAVEISGSPFTVSSGDENLYFESTAGAVGISGGPPPCTITTVSLPNATINAAYSPQTLGTTNCTAPLSWDLSAGSLPTGLTLGASTGIISGTPTVLGTGSFTARVTDNTSATATQPLLITVGTPTPTLVTVGPLKLPGIIIH